MDKVGAYNIYNIYDTCGSGNMSSSAAIPNKRSDDDDDDDDSATVGSFKSLLDLLGGGEPDQAADKGAEEDNEQSGSSEAAGIEKETALFSEHRAQLEGCGSSVSSHHHRRTEPS